eukprot:1050190_1
MPRNLRFNSVPCWRLRPDECVQRDNCQWLPGVDDYFAAFKYTCHTIDVSAKFCQAIENQDVCGNLKECTFVDGGCYHRQDHLPVSRASSDEPPCADLILHDECILRGDDCQWLPAVSAYFGYEGLDVYPESPMERIPATQPQGYGSEAVLDTQFISSSGKCIYTYVYYIESDDIFVSLAVSILDTE